MKTLKQFAEQTGYRKVKSPDEQRFVDKHEVQVNQDRAGNKDDVFKATNIKTVERKKDRKGYDAGDDEKVYEEVEQIDEANASARYHDLHSSTKDLLKKINTHLTDHKTNAAKSKDYKGQKGPSWGHVEHMKDIHRTLSDIHDRLAQQGEYAMREGVELEEKKLTPAEMKKREEVAKAIKRENPKMPMAKKMAIATATAKKVAEDLDVAISELSPRLQETMKTVFDRLNEENQQKFVAACATEEGLEKMVAFAIENRGE